MLAPLVTSLLMLAATQPAPVSPPARDPCLMRQGDTYYCYGTRDLVRTMESKDLVHWKLDQDVFPTMPEWIHTKYPEIRNLWAPDLSYFNGRYQLFYTASHFGTNVSVIGVAFNSTLDPADPNYRWVDSGSAVIESHKSDNWNALDPNFIVDAQGQPWLALGSYWSGIKLYKLDPKTLHVPADAKQYALASRGGGAIEAPFLFQHDGWYYLFVSFDHGSAGVKSTYNIRVGRSRAITGPYVDRDGKPMMQGNATLVLKSTGNVRGPGHCAVMHDGDRDLLAYHYYDADAGDRPPPRVQIRPLTWDPQGWPVAGEPVGGKPVGANPAH
ncbi:MAG: arabinan endo-1,5-alpha-L-arabinosidase [Tepidisphaeraceae bacterium]